MIGIRTVGRGADFQTRLSLTGRAPKTVSLYDRAMILGFHHVTLNVTDLGRSRTFYSALPEFDLDQDFPDLGKLRYRIGQSEARLVLCTPLPGTPVEDRFDEHRIGLDHIAVGVTGGREQLHELESRLRMIGAVTDGVHLDRAGELAMITFRDPDNIQWEFFEEA